jgi:putative PIN family toxin of toxin-antitoxin system
MRVCIDTNTLLRLFGTRDALAEIKEALLTGRLELAVSDEILLEYEEVVTRLCGPARWPKIRALLDRLQDCHGNVIHADPRFRFRVITADPDDNKFVDCAIAADADFVITDDRHFAPLAGAGYKPRPIRADAFIQSYLAN